MKKINFLLISTNEKIAHRTRDICKEFRYSQAQINESRLINQFSDLILLTTENYQTELNLLHDIRNLKTLAPESFLVISISPNLAYAQPQKLKESGADCILLDSDILSSCKLEFVAFQKVRSSHVAIKSTDLKVGTSINCFVYHLMPINQQFLPLVWPNETITEFKIERLKKIKDVYILRKDLDIFQNYSDRSNSSPMEICRSHYQSLITSYFDLMLYFADHGESMSFKKGDELLNNCIGGANNLVESLKRVNNVWPVFNYVPAGYYGSMEKSPMVASYAALLSIKSNIGNPTDTLLAALLADLGMLFLAPDLAKKIHYGIDSSYLSHFENDEYQKHPTMSLVAVLARKIEIPEMIIKIILGTHERADRKGFPYKPNPAMIPQESMLIQLSELAIRDYCVEGLDHHHSGTSKLDPSQLFNIFSDQFLAKVQKSFCLAV
ncbi:MAG: hypothetical protein JNL11_04240 [Bdellovibrionaceae bacterium]|nr:hypothetical protein [Pseudobdellovibrionaceae bacterium]